MIYLGLPVLLEDPNRREDPTHTARRSKLRVDSVTGPFTEVEKAKVQKQTRPFSWFMANRADIDAFRTFIDERKGRLVPFWIPTWHHDLRLAATGLSGSASLDILNINYSRHQFDATETWRRHLAFIKIGVGVQFIRRIDSAVENVDETETLGLSSATGIDIDPTKDQWMLSFLTMCRLESDVIPLHWHSPTTAEAVFNVVEIPQEMTAVPV